MHIIQTFRAISFICGENKCLLVKRVKHWFESNVGFGARDAFLIFGLENLGPPKWKLTKLVIFESVR